MNKPVIALCLVLIVAAVGGGVWYYVTEMGGSGGAGKESKQEAEKPKAPKVFTKPPASPEVSHTEVANAQTTTRIKLEPRRIAALLDKLVPWEKVNDLEIAQGAKKMLKDDFGEVLPREVAILGGPDFAKKVFEITLFANFQYFEVLVPLAGRKILDAIPFVTWDEKGLRVRKPGVLAAFGTIPIPEGLDAKLLEYWPALTPPADPLLVEGGHLLEFVLDNRNATLLAFLGAGAALNGIAPEQAFGMTYMDQVPKVLSKLSSLRVQADVGPAGELVVDVALRKTDDAGPEVDMGVQLVVNSFLMPQIEERLAEQGLSLEGSAQWEGPTFHAHYTLPNAESTVLGLVNQLIKGEATEEAPAGAPEAAPAPAAAAAAQAQ